jgi:ACT domain-containing protein
MGFSKLTFKKNYKTKIKKLNTIVNNKIFFFQLHKKFKNGMASNLFQVAKFSLVGDKDN